MADAPEVEETEPTPKPAPVLFSRKFVKYAAERAIKTFAQVTGAVITAEALIGGADWRYIAITIGGAVLGSLATSVNSATSSVE